MLVRGAEAGDERLNHSAAAVTPILLIGVQILRVSFQINMRKGDARCILRFYTNLILLKGRIVHNGSRPLADGHAFVAGTGNLHAGDYRIARHEVNTVIPGPEHAAAIKNRLRDINIDTVAKGTLHDEISITALST